MSPPRDDGRRRHLRPDAAPEDQGSRPLLHRRSRRGGRGDPAAGPARHPRIDDLSRARPTRSSCRCSKRRGSRSDADFFLAFSPERVDPGQRDVHDAQRSRRWSAARTGAAPSVARALYRAVVSTRRAGQFDARRRDGEAAREHVPRGQHRPRERDRADVPQDGHRRVGSDRRREDQAVRLHAVLSRSGPGRPLHSDRSVLSVLEGASDRVRSAVHRAGRPRQRRDARVRRASG